MNDIKACEDVTKDQVIIDQLDGLTNNVVTALEKCKNVFQNMKYFIEKSFPNNPAVWNEFGYNDYAKARLSQPAMIQFMKSLHGTAEKYKGNLIAVNFDQSRIDDIENCRKELDEADQAQEQFKRGRPTLTQDRVIKLNKVWSTTTEVARVGKLVYIKNYAKYQRYVLVGTTETEEPPPAP